MKVYSAAERRKRLFEHWPKDWPPRDNHVIQHDVTRKQFDEFSSLVANRVGEREIERFLTENREVLSMVIWMFSTGHHMSWLFPKAGIRTSSITVSGLIPDYIAAGANSDGLAWFVVELKGADKNAFKKSGKRVALTSEASNGVCQLLNYIDVVSRDQAYLRDGSGLVGLREPKGILLIGTEAESNDPDVRNFKRAWNQHCPQLQIRSYSALLRRLEEKLVDFGRL